MTDHLLSRRSLLRSSLLGAAALTGGSSLVSACTMTSTGAPEAGESVLERAKKEGFVRVGFANEAPYGYADETGQLTGEAPEVARKVFEALGVPELQGSLTEFGSLIPGLQAGRYDIIAAGMFITAERCAEILFSEPDYCVKSAFLVPSGNPDGLSTYEDVGKKPDLKLGVLAGAVEEGYATGAGVGKGQILTFADPTSGLEGIKAGRVDAFSLSSISLRNLLSQSGGADLELTEPFVPVVDGEEQWGCGGYGFRKGDAELRDAFNKELAKLKESGELLEIIKPFGFTEAELAEGHTTADLCKA